MGKLDAQNQGFIRVQALPQEFRELRVSQTGGTILGIPISRIIVFGGLYWGPPILGVSHLSWILQVRA